MSTKSEAAPYSVTIAVKWRVVTSGLRFTSTRPLIKKKGSKPTRIKVVIDAEDGFKINGFGESRKCEFDDSNKLNKNSI